MHEVDGMCAHTSKDTYNWRMGLSKSYSKHYKKDQGANWKLGKIGQIVNQASTLRPNHDRFGHSGLYISHQKAWWCRNFEMEFWNQTICCLMSCSNKGRHARTKGDRKSHAAFRCYSKKKVLLSTRAKVSKRKGCWSTINLATMIEATRA
jgi:hypothetical protein